MACSLWPGAPRHGMACQRVSGRAINAVRSPLLRLSPDYGDRISVDL
ncbi:hypothetical protein SAMN05216201_106194 [Pseudomonas linyingensis]|uniref:Uncharacterized protein n=1 Tax=Pseudomonas linyingensis TaxID=915471 RepID=A0A1H6XK17_9PSED|nr:hypothetical protein [Pseudomonas linyingensis]SEJ27884.1 hypothetical protein SAMN05216201_106194 [Pseudomonas linyingensis]